MSDAFFFRGPLPPSKSILIRYLLLQGYAPDLQPPWLSACDDVQVMQAAIAALTARPSPSAATTPIVEADCGEAGLVLRLCLAFAARRGGALSAARLAPLAGASPRPTLAGAAYARQSDRAS